MLGVLMLATTFERIVGDIGHRDSFDYPVLHRVVPGASVRRVIGHQDDVLVDLFADQAQRLTAAGVTAITTSCGFMARHQSALAERIAVPFAASSLCLLDTVRQHYGPVGVITADRTRLGRSHFLACSAALPEAIVGMEGRPAFRAAILEQTAPVRPHRIAAEVVAAAADLHVRHPQIRALLVECTNLPPYRRAIARATGLPVFDALTLCDGLMGRPYPWERARSAHRDP